MYRKIKNVAQMSVSLDLDISGAEIDEVSQKSSRSEQNPIQICDDRGECLRYREGVGCHCIAFQECPEVLPTWVFVFRVSGMVPLANPSANIRPKSDPPHIGRITDPEAPGEHGVMVPRRPNGFS